MNVAGIRKMWEALLGKVAEHGIVAALLVLAILAIYKLFVRLEDAQQARIDDATTYGEKLSAALEIVAGVKNERLELLELLRAAPP
jgi:hypothetical protein